MRIRWLVLTIILWLAPGVALAQERAHAGFAFGWTFGEETAGLYGAQLGVSVSDNVQILGRVERMNDVLTGRYALLLRDIAVIGGLNVVGEVPGTYYGAGARFLVPGLGGAPFLQAQFGATRTDSTMIRFLDRGEDVTDSLPEELQQLLVETTSFTFILSAGARFNVSSSAFVEMSFDFMDILAERESLGLNRLGFVVGIRF